MPQLKSGCNEVQQRGQKTTAKGVKFLFLIR